MGIWVAGVSCGPLRERRQIRGQGARLFHALEGFMRRSEQCEHWRLWKSSFALAAKIRDDDAVRVARTDERTDATDEGRHDANAPPSTHEFDAFFVHHE